MMKVSPLHHSPASELQTESHLLWGVKDEEFLEVFAPW